MTIAFEPRAVCERCRRPTRVCWCAELSTVETKTRVVLLQHPRERDMPIGTARMASLCLPNSELHVGVRFDDTQALMQSLHDPARPAMLLYPTDDATDVEDLPRGAPITLVVVDGTWWQAKKLIRENPKIAALPKVAFTPKAPSEYRIRREPLPSYVSTIEALVHVLSVLEAPAVGAERFAAMLKPFRKMVDTQLEHARVLQGGRTRHPKGPRPPKVDAMTRLWERRRELVCVMGEANAWPFSRETRRTTPDELVHWVAYRPETGERFERLIAPERGLAPFTLSELGLDASELASAPSRDEAFEAWSNFVRDSDIVCSWGPYATRLIMRAGGKLPLRRVDVRQIARDSARGNAGTMDDVLARLGGRPLPVFARGRGGERIARLAAIVEELVALGAERAERAERAANA